MREARRNIALYIHWPFCLSKCPYCDFNSHIYGATNQDEWQKSYLKSIDHFAPHILGKNIVSIFFGGGTPSLMPPSLVGSIIDKLASLGSIRPDTEITLEANPTSSCAEKFASFKNAGINRLSIGVQSFKENGLKALGREHTGLDAISAIEAAQKIFTRSSFDLIYAIPNQTLQDWQEELKAAMRYAPSHLSLYQLTIEKGTPFYRMHRDGDFALPSNDMSADMYQWTNEYLESSGYSSYEISNYASAGEECRHNLVYWNYGDYLGIGPGAHSRIQDNSSLAVMAMMHWSLPSKWLEEVHSKSAGVQQCHTLTSNEVVEEVLMMGLRLTAGISDARLLEVTGLGFANVLNFPSMRQYIDAKFVAFEDGNLRLTEKGLLMHSYLVPRLIL
ncbi:MAG: radical SAM family heme chaperone HemW [Pseudomonadota bacterium]